MNPTEDQKQVMPPVEKEIDVGFPSKRMRSRSKRRMKRRRRWCNRSMLARASLNLAHLPQLPKWSVLL